jgi:hypothetical protein
VFEERGSTNKARISLVCIALLLVGMAIEEIFPTRSCGGIYRLVRPRSGRADLTQPSLGPRDIIAHVFAASESLVTFILALAVRQSAEM